MVGEMLAKRIGLRVLNLALCIPTLILIDKGRKFRASLVQCLGLGLRHGFSHNCGNNEKGRESYRAVDGNVGLDLMLLCINIKVRNSQSVRI